MPCVWRWRKHLAPELPGKARVVEDYLASDPEPLVIITGELLKVGQNDTRWPAFVRCSNRVGKSGWVPHRKGK